MNKIYKVMYSKVKQCAVVVSEIAKSHGRHTKEQRSQEQCRPDGSCVAGLGSFLVCRDALSPGYRQFIQQRLCRNEL